MIGQFGLVALVAILTALLIVSEFEVNPWRLDLRKVMAAQALFWLGVIAVWAAALMMASRAVGGLFSVH